MPDSVLLSREAQTRHAQATEAAAARARTLDAAVARLVAAVGNRSDPVGLSWFDAMRWQPGGEEWRP